MNLLLEPLKLGAQAALSVTATAIKVGTNVVKTAELLLGRANGDDQRFAPAATPPQGTSADRRAAVRSDAVEIATAPPEPTSAAGASGGVAGTADAPGAAAAAGAPDPTTGTVPRGERRVRDVSPTPRTDAAARRAGGNGSTVVVEAELVESEGAASPGATIDVQAPWEGYDAMTAADIVDRLRTSNESVKAVVLLYERTNKNRKSIIGAAS
jgi:hypothetical protein